LQVANQSEYAYQEQTWLNKPHTQDGAPVGAPARPAFSLHHPVSAPCVGALVFLLLAAATTLTLPMAVRRMIDHGFSAQDAGFINTYFSMLAAIAVILALASACRYYFVITLGERVVSDIRRDVFPRHQAVRRFL
jgi:ABC-type multidrug transport system fused ATPase/permease subunit